MSGFLKPLSVALKGKGPLTFIKRAWTLSRRYGPTTARMDRSLAQLVDVLRRYECHATLPITAVALERNPAVAQKYQEQGVEFAIHGYRHIDYSQLGLAEQRTHLEQARQIFAAAGIRVEGFRCPYLRENADTLTALSQAGLVYDSSPSLVWEVAAQHKTESYARVLDFYGARPAAEHLALPALHSPHGLVRIPYCLPDDESLIERLHWISPAEMEQVWPAMFQDIHARGELFTLGLHPERAGACAGALVATLEQVRAAGAAVWRARLGEIAAWWRARAAAALEVTPLQDDGVQLALGGPPGVTLLLRGLEARTRTVPHADGYRQAVEWPCVVRVARRPFIGLSPDAHPALADFLKQQGYIIETTSEPARYAFYLDQSKFSPQEGRRLLARIETTQAPLARLGRWPNGARSAFAVTGDIDALTLWDYIQRLREK